MKRFFGAVALLFAVSFPSQAMVVKSDQTGNLFVSGKPVQFTVSEAQGDVKYELINYYGSKVAEGTASAKDGTAKIALPGLKPCWYELKTTDGKDTITTYLGAVIDRNNAPLSKKGRVGTDTALSHLVSNPELYPKIAKMLRMAGIPWVRERHSWGHVNKDIPGLERNLGEFNFEEYQEIADAFHAEGVGICTTWQHIPGFAKPDYDRNLYRVGDYRTVYNFAKATAARFKDQITAWEPFNESDMGWVFLSNTFAPIQKAYYLGIKAGNPDAQVMYTSVSQITPEAFAYNGQAWFHNGNYASGVGDYFDIFNYHSYLPSWFYPSQLEHMRKQMRMHGIPDKPAWVTEAGIQIYAGDKPVENYHNRDNEQKICRFAAMSPTMSLAAGTDKYFYFVLPYYNEGGFQYGLLRSDLTPEPAFLSLSANANFIGVSEYLGEYCPNAGQMVCQAFSTPKGNVLVVWSDKEAELAVPTEKPWIQVADMFGQMSTVAAKDGWVRIKVKREATYLVNVGEKIKAQIVPSKSYKRQFWQPDTKPKAKPSTIVLASNTDLECDRGCDSYKLGAGAIAVAGGSFDYTVEVYQFDEKKGASGTIELTGPRGWIIENPKRPVKLKPMDRVVMKFRVTPVPSFMGSEPIIVRGKFANEKVAPSYTYFRYFADVLNL